MSTASPPLSIRPEQPGDVEAIGRLTEAAFLAAPHTSHTEQFIVAALRRHRQLAVSLVAQADGRIVGHVAASPVSISSGEAGWFGLGPISVEPARQGQGIGSALMNSALQALRERGAQGCVLLGDPAYYRRFGFAPMPQLVLAGVPPEYFQALAFGDAAVSGEVRYHEAFEAKN